MKKVAKDHGTRALSMTLAFGVNFLIFASIFLVGMTEGQPEAPELLEINFMELARKSDVAPKPKQLERITKPPAPPPPETDAIGLKKKKEEEEFEKKKKKKERERKIAEKRRRDADKRTKKEIERRKRDLERKRQRRKNMERALNRVDPRADDEDAPGYKNGHELGQSTDPRTLKNRDNYLNLIGREMNEQFDKPTTIPEAYRNKIVEIRFRIGAKGKRLKVIGKPRVVRSSGNESLDTAALTAVRRFGTSASRYLPDPPSEKVRKMVLGKYTTAEFNKKEK